jgi:hypothetical protein
VHTCRSYIRGTTEADKREGERQIEYLIRIETNCTREVDRRQDNNDVSSFYELYTDQTIRSIEKRNTNETNDAVGHTNLYQHVLQHYR